MKILNLTQHPISDEQSEAGVYNAHYDALEVVRRLLTFNERPTFIDIEYSARRLAEIAAHEGADAAMIGGAPFLMSALERALKDYGIQPLYAFSKRESVEETLPDGSVRKTAVFRHEGFVKV